MGAALLAVAIILTALSCSEKLINEGSGDHNVAINAKLMIPDLVQAINRLRLTVKAEDFDPIITEKVWDGRSVIFEVNIPAGANRYFLLEAYDTRGAPAVDSLSLLIYSGTAIVNVGSDGITAVPIEMVPRVPLVKVTPTHNVIAAGAQFRLKLETFNMTDLTQAAVYLSNNYDHMTIDSATRGSSLTDTDTLNIFYGEVADFIGLSVNLPIRNDTTDFLDQNGYCHIANLFYTSRYLADTADIFSTISMGDSQFWLKTGQLNYDQFYEHYSVIQFRPATDIALFIPDTSLMYYLDNEIRRVTGLPAGTEIMLSHALRLRYISSMFDEAHFIDSLTGIGQLANLESLGLSNQTLTDLTPLADLARLEVLRMSYCSLTPTILTTISSMTRLEYIDLRWNSLADISALETMTGLRTIYLDNNQITDITPLVNNTGLGQYDYVYLRNNPLDNNSTTVLIPQLQARGVTVTL